MRRRAILFLFTAAALTACNNHTTSPTSPGNTNVVIFNAQLSPSNEVPPVTNAESSGTGNVQITFNITRDTSNNVVGAVVTFVLNLSGFPNGSVLTNAHIHQGVPGVVGPIVVNTTLNPANPITLMNGSVSNQTFANIPVTDVALIENIVTNPSGFYFDIHTMTNAAGAARAQLTVQR